VKALARAKAALIGFAATYADDPDHKGQPQGYLPCPDVDGDGSAETCSSRGKTVLGRFPWRTLGLPPLRDGSGECLWYVVSGTYKDNPKGILTSDTDGQLTSDTDGQLVVESLETTTFPGTSSPVFGPPTPIAGQPNVLIEDDGYFSDGRKKCKFKRGVENTDVPPKMPDTRTQALAIIFAPGQAIGSQSRVGDASAQRTECGWTKAPSADGNQAYNYLDNQILAVDKNNDGVINNSDCYVDFNNATATDTFEDHSIIDGKFFDYRDDLITDLTNTLSAANRPPNRPVVQSYFNSTFLSAPETKDANGQVIFNDVLSIITPKDFEPVYRRMNEWVAERVTQCIVNYATENKNNFFSKYATPIGASENPAVGTYRKAQETYIENFVDISTKRCKALDCDQTCKNYCGDVEDLCKSDCADTACETACESATTTCISNCGINKPTCEAQCNTKKAGYRKSALDSNATRYPWATTNVQDDTDPDFFKGETGQRFGRIPLTPSNSYDSINSDPDLPATWAGIGYSKTAPDNEQCFAQPSGTNDYKWWWWKSWKYLVFYAIGAIYAPQESTYLWIKTARDISQNAAGKWVDENWNDTTTDTGYVTKRDAVKAATLAKIKSPISAPISVSDWEHVTPVPAFLTLTNQLNVDWWETDDSGNLFSFKKNQAANFLIIVAGRKLTTQSDRDNPAVVKNYLESENIPTPATTIPLGDEKFERKPLTDQFNDVVCINTRADCKKIPREGNK
jgi:hypothetical protein